jgi:hypothetical protein
MCARAIEMCVSPSEIKAQPPAHAQLHPVVN